LIDRDDTATVGQPAVGYRSPRRTTATASQESSASAVADARVATDRAQANVSQSETSRSPRLGFAAVTIEAHGHATIRSSSALEARRPWVRTKLMDRYGAAVMEVPIDGPIPLDVDTWADYEALAGSAGP
jgi:hypothetical protein